MGPAPGFDAWLQRGCLAAKYREQFATIAVMLKKPLPPGLIAQLFANQGLIPQGERNVVRHRYIGPMTADSENEDHTVAQWKARYCVWTHLGDWLSEECYDSKRDLMVAKSKSERQARIKDLLGHGQDSVWRNERKRLFLEKMDGMWNVLLSASFSPSDFLDDCGRGIDKSHYGARFDKKLSSDLQQAQDASFRDRYINGYEFPDVPKFRQDAIAWQQFVLSWCESVSVEAAKKVTKSLITKTIRDAVEPSELLELEPYENSRQATCCVEWQRSRRQSTCEVHRWGVLFR